MIIVYTIVRHKALGLTFQSCIILLTLSICFINNSMLNLKTTRNIK